MPLKLVLKPGERVVVNQAVILNGGEKAELVIENQANVLRDRDILTEAQADTPAKCVYFALQMMYMFSENKAHYEEQFNQFMRDFVTAVPSSTNIALEIGKKVLGDDLYGALKSCNKLLEYEQKVLSHVAEQH